MLLTFITFNFLASFERDKIESYCLKFIYLKKLAVNVIVRLPNPQSGDNQGKETFLAPTADKQTRNYDTDLKPTSLPITTKVKRIEMQQDETVSYIHKFTRKCYSQSNPSFPWSRDIYQGFI